MMNYSKLFIITANGERTLINTFDIYLMLSLLRFFLLSRLILFDLPTVNYRL